jgi:hypothetical protein
MIVSCACGQRYRLTGNGHDLRLWPCATALAGYSRVGLTPGCGCFNCGRPLRAVVPLAADLGGREGVRPVGGEHAPPHA